LPVFPVTNSNLHFIPENLQITQSCLSQYYFDLTLA
jgi:hypothetical protein